MSPDDNYALELLADVERLTGQLEAARAAQAAAEARAVTLEAQREADRLRFGQLSTEMAALREQLRTAQTVLRLVSQAQARPAPAEDTYAAWIAEELGRLVTQAFPALLPGVEGLLLSGYAGTLPMVQVRLQVHAPASKKLPDWRPGCPRADLLAAAEALARAGALPVLLIVESPDGAQAEVVGRPREPGPLTALEKKVLVAVCAAQLNGALPADSKAEVFCLKCRARLDRHTSADEKHPRPLRPGALSICEYCGACAVYEWALRPLTDDEIRDMAPQTSKVVRQTRERILAGMRRPPSSPPADAPLSGDLADETAHRALLRRLRREGRLPQPPPAGQFWNVTVLPTPDGRKGKFMAAPCLAAPDQAVGILQESLRALVADAPFPAVVVWTTTERVSLSLWRDVDAGTMDRFLSVDDPGGPR